jgi:hypothetical protein
MQYLACAINSILMEHMDMDVSWKAIADEHPQATAANKDAVAAEVEFWDACWTLEDESHPHVVSLRSPARRGRSDGSASAEVYALL